MVLSRLSWRVGPLSDCLYAFRPNTSATECLTAFLGTLRHRKGLTVFIDLEKAFEVANPDAILAALVEKGIGGRLLSWLASFLRFRCGRVRFQGSVSPAHVHHLGTPQGSVLSPFLFNILMEGLAQPDYGQHVRLFIYADDLVLLSTGPRFVERTERALRSLHSRCRDLGLKVNTDKSRFMTFRATIPEVTLRVGGQEIQRCFSHRYLGVWLDHHLSLTTQVRYLRERASARQRALRALSCRGAGASLPVLRLFYIQSIRSLVAYCAPCLTLLQPTSLRQLEVIQSDALRTILGAPPWTRLCNLRAECGLPSLHNFVLSCTSMAMCRMVRRRPATPLTRQFHQAFQRPPATSPDGDWLHSAADAVRLLNVEAVVRGASDLPHPAYVTPPPWDPPPFHCVTPASPRPRGAHVLALRQSGLRQIASLASPVVSTYFTDGSVSPDGGAGAAAITGAHTLLWRLPSGSSVLQTELVAILGALLHSLQSPADTVIHTDSLSAIQTLSHCDIKDNVKLTTHILHLAASLRAHGYSATLSWIPSHTGISGNERADAAARQAASLEQAPFPVVPSLSRCLARIRAASWHRTRQDHLDAVESGSFSAGWYTTATDNRPLELPRIPPGVRVSLHRLRLGYTGRSVFLGRPPDPCPHCHDVAEAPLTHYLRDCPATEPLRYALGRPLNLEDELDTAAVVAAAPTALLLDTVTRFPPPR